MILSLRVGKDFSEPSTASFFATRRFAWTTTALQAAAELERTEAIVVCIGRCQRISPGNSAAADGESSEGVFVAVMSDHTEFSCSSSGRKLKPVLPR